MKAGCMAAALCVLLLLASCSDAPSGSGGEPESGVVEIDGVVISGKDLRAYALTNANPLEGEAGMDNVIRALAKTQLARAEIQGTEYEAPPEDMTALMAQEEEAFWKNPEENQAFLDEFALAREDAIYAFALSKRDIRLTGNHAQMVSETIYSEGVEANGAQDLLALYNAYVDEKVDKMSIRILDAGQYAAIEKDLLRYAEGIKTYESRTATATG